MIQRGANGAPRAAQMTALALLILACNFVTSALEEPQSAEAPDPGQLTFRPPAIPEELLQATGAGQIYTIEVRSGSYCVNWQDAFTKRICGCLNFPTSISLQEARDFL